MGKLGLVILALVISACGKSIDGYYQADENMTGGAINLFEIDTDRGLLKAFNGTTEQHGKHHYFEFNITGQNNSGEYMLEAGQQPYSGDMGIMLGLLYFNDQGKLILNMNPGDPGMEPFALKKTKVKHTFPVPDRKIHLVTRKDNAVIRIREDEQGKIMMDLEKNAVTTQQEAVDYYYIGPHMLITNNKKIHWWFTKDKDSNTVYCQNCKSDGIPQIWKLETR